MVRTAGVNLAWQTGHDAELVAAACDGADVVFVCEALTLNAEGPLDLRKILPIGWAVFQDLSSAARAGSAVCWRTSTIAEDGPGELLAGSPAGGGTRARHIASKRLKERATGDSRPYAAFHAPKRSTDLQDEFYASLDRYAANHPRAVLGGDCNRPPLEVATLLGRRAVHSEVMGIFHPLNIPTIALVPKVSTWSDHPIVRANLVLPTPPKEQPVSGLCPFATHRIIPPGANDPAIKPRLAILHVDAGDAESLYEFFRTRSGGIESHFHVQRDGGLEQYRGIYHQADANNLANDFAVSIETQGRGAGEWTAAQLATIKRLLLWLNKEAGIPLVKVPRWDGAGVGYHVQFGAPGPWTPVAKSCPGPDRIKQFDSVLVPWMKTVTNPIPQEDEVSAQEVWNHPVPFTGDPDKVGDKRPVFISVVETHNAVEQIKDDIEDLKAADVRQEKLLTAILAKLNEAG